MHQILERPNILVFFDPSHNQMMVHPASITQSIDPAVHPTSREAFRLWVKDGIFRRSGIRAPKLEHQKRTLYPLRQPHWDEKSSHLRRSFKKKQLLVLRFFCVPWLKRIKFCPSSKNSRRQLIGQKAEDFPLKTQRGL